MFSIDSKKFKKQLDTLISELPNTVDVAMTIIASEAANEARTKIAYTPRAAAGQGLQGKTIAYRNSAFEHGIKADTEYASWVEYGNGPAGSKIYPTKSSVLHFFLPDGTEIFTKWVKASKPHPFMASAVSWLNSGNPEKILTYHIMELIRGL